MALRNFTSLQTLLVIAELGTFTAAAKRLNTTQSAISARMRELENNLGYPLFFRHGRQLQLTLAARQFIERIKPLIGALEDAFNEVEEVDNPRGNIRIGLPEVAISWLSHRLVQLHDEMPRLQFTLETQLTTSVQNALEEGQIDIGIVASPKRSSALRYTMLGSTSLRWVCATSMLFDERGRKRGDKDLLSSKLLWIVPENSAFHSPSREELIELGGNPNHLCTTALGSVDIALAGGGIVLLPEAMVKSYVDDKRLAYVGAPLKSIEVKLFLAIHKDQKQNVIKRVVNFLVDAAKIAPP